MSRAEGQERHQEVDDFTCNKNLWVHLPELYHSLSQEGSHFSVILKNV